MKKVLVSLSAVALLFLSGCCIPRSGVMFSSISNDQGSPGHYQIDNSVKPLKCGKATVKGIIFISSGNASIKAAMDNGGIKKIHHVDFETTNIFNIYTTVTTIVWGE